MHKHFLLLIFNTITIVGYLSAQTTVDPFMMKKQEICFAGMYEHGTWDHYWEGNELRINQNIGTFTRNTAMAMVAYGINNKLNAIVAIPYVKTFSDGGQLAGVKGFQDINLGLKYEALNKELSLGKLTLHGVVNYATPLSNYLSDYMPYSLGFGTNEITLRGIAQLELKNGIYARGAGAWLWRGQTQAERDFYYNNGAFYTTYMDVPNAVNFHAVLGKWLFNYSWRIELNYMSHSCLSGDDIRKYNAPQPTNKVNYNQVGVFSQYYFKKTLKGLGLLAYYAHITDGRNMGQFTSYGGGVTYQFQVLPTKQ